MSENFGFKKFYLNHANGQAIGVICKEDTATWGKCIIVETATPQQIGRIVAMDPNHDSKDWKEIQKEDFRKLQQTYTTQAFAIAKVAADQKKGAIRRWSDKAKKVLIFPKGTNLGSPA